ncbi:Hypothetical_protein [Hexamita inflata]|uniref:Hypothetical_protein n=1 Tax=Hexamita inflata TaxID=28002 RepID=A0AA86NXJ8_9EUKA|nr:Hypothetical protein HINF_LOCUS14858 [Hexamita inflata]
MNKNSQLKQEPNDRWTYYIQGGQAYLMSRCLSAFDALATSSRKVTLPIQMYQKYLFSQLFINCKMYKIFEIERSNILNIISILVNSFNYYPIFSDKNINNTNKQITSQQKYLYYYLLNGNNNLVVI